MGRNKKFTKKEELQICNEYFSKEKHNTYDLAKKWNCSNFTIWAILKRNKYDLRPMSEAKKLFSNKQELQICKWYVVDKLSCHEIAKKLNRDAMVIWHTIKRNGHVPRTISEANSTLEFIQRALKNSYGTKCYYKGEFFPSKFERNGFIKLIELGFKVEHNFLGRFDFLVVINNKKVVVEFHSYDRNGLTYKQYYNQRRKLLNKYGYKNLKLIVIKDLKEIESKLVKAGVL